MAALIEMLYFLVLFQAGQTALMCAAAHGNVDAVEYLMKHNAAVNVETKVRFPSKCDHDQYAYTPIKIQFLTNA